MTALAPQHGDACLVVGVEDTERPGQRLGGGSVDGVARLGTTEDHCPDGSIVLDSDRGFRIV